MSKGQRNSSGRSRREERLSEDEIDAFHSRREKILLGEDEENSHGEDEMVFDETVMDLPSDSQGEEEDNWGRNKKTFYTADVGKEDLHDEAKEARRLQRKQLASLQNVDFITLASGTSGRVQIDFSDDDSNDDLEDKFSSEREISELDVEKVTGLILPETEKIILSQKYAPELAQFMNEFKKRIEELRNSLLPAMEKLKTSSKKGLSFLETKYQLLLGYCANLAFYMKLKIDKVDVEKHPVIERLVKYRLLIEKIKPLESKLQYQIDKLLRSADNHQVAGRGLKKEDRDLAFRPNVGNMLLDDEASSASGDDQVYKAPKVAPMHFDDGKKKTSHKGKVDSSRSQHLLDMKAGLSSEEEEPEEDFIDPVYGKSAKENVQFRHRDEYEEENFVRFNLDKAERSQVKQAGNNPIDELEDLDDFLTERESKRERELGALERALSVKRPKEKRSLGGDDDIPGVKRSRAVPVGATDNNESEMSEIEDDMGGEDEFYRQAKQQQRARKDSKGNNKAAKHRPLKDIDSSANRPASYQMIKNKGLTPSRPKEVRNPRVRQRNRWEKAQKKIKSFKPVKSDHGTPYQGESTGIRTNLSRSVKF